MFLSSDPAVDGSKHMSSSGGGGRKRPHPADDPVIVTKDSLTIVTRNDVAVKSIQPDSNGVGQSITSLAAVGKVQLTSCLSVQVAESRDMC